MNVVPVVNRVAQWTLHSRKITLDSQGYLSQVVRIIFLQRGVESNRCLANSAAGRQEPSDRAPSVLWMHATDTRQEGCSSDVQGGGCQD